MEMQHILAGAITKILNQKSIRDSVANLHQLVVDELLENKDKCADKSMQM
jgi:hypothetical protein